jgi:hypothetical protein
MGWSAHYGIGVIFAALLLAIWGLDWARQPTLIPALIIGVATVVAPFFLYLSALLWAFLLPSTPLS